MPSFDSLDSSSGTFGNRLPLVFAIAWGALLGGLTFAIGPISWGSQNPSIDAMRVILMVLLLPGLIGGMAFAGNVHAFSLLPGAIINGLFHFGLCWLLIRMRARFKRRAKVLTIIACLLASYAFGHAQDAETDLFQNAKHLYRTGHLAEAERSFRELVNRDPSNVGAQMFLGQTLFPASIGEFVGKRQSQRRRSARKRNSLRHVESKERCSSSEPLWISGPPSASST